MDYISLMLVLAGSVLHVGWNIIAKSSQDRLAMLWWAITPVGVLGSIYYGPQVNWLQLEASAYLCLLTTALIHAGYFYYLSRAYAVGDLSFVYPYSRGLATALTALCGILILGEKPSMIGWIGICLAVLAVIAEPYLSQSAHSQLNAQARRLVMITGIFITAYLIIDKMGLYYFEPIPYLCFMLSATGLLMLPFIIRKGRLMYEYRQSSRRIILGAAFLFSSYGLILIGMAAAPIAYVAAVRSIGIVISGIAGVLVLKEKVTLTRWAMIGLITVSIVLIKLA